MRGSARWRVARKRDVPASAVECDDGACHHGPTTGSVRPIGTSSTHATPSGTASTSGQRLPRSRPPTTWGQSFLDRIPAFIPGAFPCGIDVFPYTRAELERMKSSGNPFVLGALREGRTILRRSASVIHG
jgi:hypothetical protein